MVACPSQHVTTWEVFTFWLWMSKDCSVPQSGRHSFGRKHLSYITAWIITVFLKNLMIYVCRFIFTVGFSPVLRVLSQNLNAEENMWKKVGTSGTLSHATLEIWYKFDNQRVRSTILKNLGQELQNWYKEPVKSWQPKALLYTI